MPGAAAGDDAVVASLRHGAAISAAAVAQGVEILRRALQARSRVVDYTRCSGGLLLHATAGNHSRRKPEAVRLKAPSVQAHAARLDDHGPFLNLAIEESLEILRRPAIGTNSGDANLFQPLLHRGRVQGRHGDGVESLYDCCGRALGQEE